MDRMGQSEGNYGRMEARMDIPVAVQLRGEKRRPEMTLTLDVSAHGACVQTRRPWNSGEHLAVQSLAGDLFSQARVTYCLQTKGEGYVIGLHLIQPCGRWILNPPPENPTKPGRKDQKNDT